MAGLERITSQGASALPQGLEVASAAPSAASRGPDPAVLARRQELVLDLAQVALDIVGIFEPTPVADGANAVISLGRGQWMDAILSGAGVLPYVGDLAKLGKLGSMANKVANAIELARVDPAFARMARPVLEKISDALAAMPRSVFESLPHGAQQQLNRMSRQLDEALGTRLADSSFIPSRTAPTGQIGDVPGGTRTTNPPNADPLTKRGIGRENESADILAANGYRVEQNPALTDADRLRDGIAPGKNPDYRIEGRIFDSYAPTTRSAEGVYEGIAAKVDAGQTHRIVLNLKDTDVRAGDVQRLLREQPIPGLQEVIVVDRSGGLHRSFP